MTCVRDNVVSQITIVYEFFLQVGLRLQSDFRETVRALTMTMLTSVDPQWFLGGHTLGPWAGAARSRRVGRGLVGEGSTVAVTCDTFDRVIPG